MGTGYTRNDTANNIADGNIINASDLDGEFDAVQSAFNASTGHTHDGTAGEGAPIETIGPSQDVVATASVLRPKTDNTVDLGTTSLEYKDLFLDGTAHIDTLDVDENASITGTLGVTGTTTLGTANITTGTITTADINGGNIDGTIIGASSAAAITGTTITGTSFVTSGDMTFGDNDKAIFGAGSDLQIYHDGSHSYIHDNGTGDLIVRAENFRLTDAGNTEFMMQAVPNGAVTLYHNGSSKLATTSTGIDVTGVITTDGMTTSADINVADNVSIRFGDATNGDLVIKHDGTNSSIVDRGDGDLLIQGSTNVKLQNFTGSKDYFVGSNGGASTVYYDGSAKLATTSTGVDITGTLTSDGLTMASGSQAVIGVFGTSGLQLIGQTGSDNIVGTMGSSEPLIFRTVSSERMRIDSSGNVGIGTTSPAQELDVNGQVRGVDRYYFKRASDNYSLSALARWDGSTGSPLTGTAGIHTVVGSEEASSSVIFAPSNTERMRIDSSGNVGIGTGSPSSYGHSLVVAKDASGGATYATITNTNANQFLNLGINADVAEITWDNADSLAFGTTAASTDEGQTFEAMRIDSSGNLLVGKTSTSTSTAGGEIRNHGGIVAVRDDQWCGLFNRLTGDGELLRFQKDGTVVGSIASRAGLVSTFILDPRSGGAGISSGGPILYPTNESGALTNGNMDFGAASYRWKDLYLSGGVYLGGTGSANKLDDYESGEFDVTASPVTSGTVTLQSANNRASYTKVGRLVHCSGFFIVDSVSSPVGTELHMTLPFAAGQGGDQSLRVGMPIVYYDGSSDTVKPAIVVETQSIVKIILDCSTITAGDAFYYGFTYQSA